MTYEKAKKLSEKIAKMLESKDEIKELARSENLLAEFEWCERESCRCDFLTKSERRTYRNALFDAVLWGRVVKQQ